MSPASWDLTATNPAIGGRNDPAGAQADRCRSRGWRRGVGSTVLQAVAVAAAVAAFRPCGGVVVEQTYESVAAWRAAGEAGDAAAAVAALGPDVTLVSPITDQFVFRGVRQVRDLLDVALAVIGDIRYTDQVAQGRTVALFYEASIGGRRLHEAQRLRLGDHGLISEITLFIRPLPALTLLARRLGPALARRQGEPGLARLIPLAGGLLH